MPKKKKQEDEKPKVHKDLDGFELGINEFGEITSNTDITKLNNFLNKNVDDKKLRDRSDLWDDDDDDDYNEDDYDDDDSDDLMRRMEEEDYDDDEDDDDEVDGKEVPLEDFDEDEDDDYDDEDDDDF